MIETVMLAALGFLGATVLWLLALPAISRRADRLARRRAELTFPLSMQEISAERDHLRAGFAVRERELERRIAAAQADKVAVMAREGDRTRDIAALKATLDQRDAAIADLEQDLRETRETLGATRATLAAEEKGHAATRADLAVHMQALVERDRDIAELRVIRADLSADLATRTRELESMTTRANGLDASLTAVSAEFAALHRQHEDLSLARDQLRISLAESETQSIARAAEIQDLRDRLSATVEQLSAEREALAAARAETRAAEAEAAAMASDRDRQVLRLNASDGTVAKLTETLKEVRTTRQVAEQKVAAIRSELNDVKAALKKAQGDATRASAAAGSSGREADLRLRALQDELVRHDAELVRLRAERAAMREEVTTLRGAAERAASRLRAENEALRGEIVRVASLILNVDGKVASDRHDIEERRVPAGPAETSARSLRLKRGTKPRAGARALAPPAE